MDKNGKDIIYTSELVEDHLKDFMNKCMESSKIYNDDIAPILGMFNDPEQIALKVMFEKKDDWGDLIKRSSKEFMEDTNSLVNGVVLLNQARMVRIDENQDDVYAKIAHYVNTVGSIEGCPYAEEKEVVILHCYLRSHEKIFYVSEVKKAENGERTFTPIESLSKDEGVQGMLSEIAGSIFEPPIGYNSIEC